MHIQAVGDANNNFSDRSNFFSAYTIKSARDKQAIVVEPKDIKGFIDDLKILVQIGYEASFKLTQVLRENVIKKYLEITASQNALTSKSDS